MARGSYLHIKSPNVKFVRNNTNTFSQSPRKAIFDFGFKNNSNQDTNNTSGFKMRVDVLPQY
jgi:hypothetical protein